MTETERYLALGLTPPEMEGGNEQEVADPADEGQEPDMESENTPEVADPEEDPDTEPDEEPEGEGGNEREVADPAPNEDGKPAQDKATNSRNAARRRKAELQRKLEAARKEEREKYEARLNRALVRAGFKDGEVLIDNLDGFESYLDKSEQAKLSRDLSQGKLTAEALQDMVQRSVERAVSAAAPPEASDGEDAGAAFREQVEAELEEIRKYDPSVKTVADLRRLDRADAFMEAVTQHNHSFIDAYKFVYADKIAEAKAKSAAAAAAQKARNSAAGKDHLRGTGARGAGDVTIPDNVMKKIRRMLPGASDKEIREAYSRHYKK